VCTSKLIWIEVIKNASGFRKQEPEEREERKVKKGKSGLEFYLVDINVRAKG
jgi:hypothetical protein